MTASNQPMVMAEQLIDGQVIEACQQGDRARLSTPLRNLQRQSVFHRRLFFSGGDRALADDVTQQIFLKLFTAIRQFRGDSEFTTWLYRLVVNACLDERRRRRRLLPWGETVAMKKSERTKTSGETVRAARSRGSGAGGDWRAQAKVSFADFVEVHRGFVIRGDRERDGLFERHGGFATESWSQPVSEATVAFKQSRR